MSDKKPAVKNKTTKKDDLKADFIAMRCGDILANVPASEVKNYRAGGYSEVE
jgi:hypothetical protein